MLRQQQQTRTENRTRLAAPGTPHSVDQQISKAAEQEKIAEQVPVENTQSLCFRHRMRNTESEMQNQRIIDAERHAESEIQRCRIRDAERDAESEIQRCRIRDAGREAQNQMQNQRHGC